MNLINHPDRRVKGRRLAALLLLSLSGPALAAGDCQQASRLFVQYQQAVAGKAALLEQAVGLCPTHKEALNNLGVLRERQGRLKEAEALYRRAIAVDPDMAAPYAGLGDVCMDREDHACAVEAYERFLELLQGVKRLGDPDGLARHEAAYRAKLNRALSRSGRPPRLITAREITRSLTTVVSSTRGIGAHYKDQAAIDIPIHFGFNSARISPASMSQMEQIAKALGSPVLRGKRIRIEGHTDSVGAEEYNQRLSEQRANAVRRMLVERYGMPAPRFEVQGFGESRPVASNATEQGRARNRRVTFVNLGE